LPFREAILNIIGRALQKDRPLNPGEAIVIPAASEDLAVRSIIEELIRDGFIAEDALGQAFLFGDSGQHLRLVLTRKGALLYERYSTQKTKDEQILNLADHGCQDERIAKLVDASLAYVKLILLQQVENE
jgi:hypothetical protein